MTTPQTILWSPGVSLDAIEKMVILKAFEFFKRNKVATSTSLGIAVRTLENKLERYEQEEVFERDRANHDMVAREIFLAKQRGNPPNNIGIPYTAQERASHYPGPRPPAPVSVYANGADKPDSILNPEAPRVSPPIVHGGKRK